MRLIINLINFINFINLINFQNGSPSKSPPVLAGASV